jgi:hypothetical protein
MTKATKSRSLCRLVELFCNSSEEAVFQKIHKVCLTLTHCARNVDAALQSRMEFGWKTRSVLMWEQKDTT